MSPEDQPTILTPPPNGSRPAPVGWQAPTVEELQAKLPQYEVLEILGRGGMGAVYKARQKSLKRLVAIKILPLGLADDEFKFAERFQNEAQTMAAMNHPAIVGVYDFGETPDGLLYFVMEFVDGTDVHQMIAASGRLSSEHALAIAAHVCDALAYAHARGVIHRDIKPANILIDQEGRIKVADFGLAKMSDPAQTSGLTRTNMAMGTPDYVAPEVLSPGMVADHRADLYAVGVMLYQMLTGEVPRGMFKLPSQKGIGSDPRFDEIICKAMEQDREERYQSASDVRRALDEIATTPLPKNDGTGIVPAKKMPLDFTSTSTHPQLPPNVPSAKSADLVPAAKRSPATMKLTIGGIALILSVAAFLILGGKPKPQESPTADNASATAPSTKTQPPSTLREITGTGKVDALPAGIVPASASGSAPPNFTTWKDMTTEMRDRARGVAGVVVEADAVRIAPGGTSTPVIPITTTGMRDCAVRLRHAGGGQVNLRVNPDGFLFVLCQRDQTIFKRYDKAAPTSAVIAPSALHPAGFDYEGRHETIVTIQGSTIRTWVDGRFLGEAQDTKFPTGNVGLALMPSTAIYQVEIADLTPSPAAAAPLTSSETIDWLKRDAWSAPFVLENGVLKSTTKDAEGRIGWAADFTLRLRVRTGTIPDVTKPSLQLTVRSAQNADRSKRSYYLFQFFPQKRTCNLLYLEKDPSGRSISTQPLWEETPFPGTAQEFEVEMRAEGDKLSLWSAGKEVVSARDARVPEGATRILASPGIEITRLETVGIKADANSPAPAPPSADWQDVTETVREKLSSKQGFTVGPEGIALSGEGETVYTPLLEGGVGDRAVRVRYIGQTQISLWFAGGGGSAFVLAQRDRVMFKRQRQKDGEADTLRPSVMHPAGFDATQPHELLVAVQRATVRAWLDGRLVGEAEEEPFQQSALTLVPIKESTVQKVEIAELK